MKLCSTLCSGGTNKACYGRLQKRMKRGLSCCGGWCFNPGRVDSEEQTDHGTEHDADHLKEESSRKSTKGLGLSVLTVGEGEDAVFKHSSSKYSITIVFISISKMAFDKAFEHFH